ncbi:GerAB/ArcD/ProY family transporter [Neobacillus sp. PS3-40]|uniref:GerAB/ArcD/ProY family transporter n=1 Tax=Neobacillus sp. PS3-40 TaxID=3070679 RepID=UPI0027DEE880|nr:GerAB/ArcD/ProY family transporter [Neobacillus sp. PS3-40]WML44163.1 GerAB/ArcD/ProY family transporter [Neobacillus sp. PS3-40]
MNRYFIYLILLNMLTNIIIFVPKILMTYRFEGAVLGILIAIPIGLALCFVFNKAMSKFPEQGLPEILNHFNNRKIKIAILVCFSCIWFSAGLLSLLGFVDIVKRFINPEISEILLAVLFLGAICFVAQLPSQKVMYLIEIILFINVPLTFFIVFKAFTSKYFSWDSVFEVGTHIFMRPSFTSIAAATYAYSGYLNLLIINRLFKNKIKGKNYFIILFLVIFNLFTTFFIPIGFHGADSVQEYLYPWISTADCLRIVYGPIERALYIFLMLYTSITLLSTSLHWHVAFEFLKGVSREEPSQKKKWIIFAIFICLSIVAEWKINALQLIKISSYWLNGRFIFEAFVAALLLFLARRQKT